MRTFSSPIGGIGLAAIMAASTAGPAAAVGLFNGSSIQVDGITYTVSNCQDTATPNAALTPCLGSIANPGTPIAEIVTQAGPGSAVLIDKNGGGTLFSASANNQVDELKFTLTMTPSASTGATSKTTINSGVTTLTGSAPSGTAVTDAYSYTGLTGTTFTQATPLNLTTPTNTSTFNTVTNTSAFSFTMNNDLKLSTSTGQTYTLSSLLLRFTPAPEPVSTGIFLVGLAGIGAARRLKKNKSTD